MGAVKYLYKSNLVTRMDVDEKSTPSQCPTCIQGKSHAMLFPPWASDQDFKLAELITADVWGPVNITGTNGAHYYFQFMDIKA